VVVLSARKDLDSIQNRGPLPTFSLNRRVAVPTARAGAVEGGVKTLASRADARGESESREDSEDRRRWRDKTRHASRVLIDVSAPVVKSDFTDQVGETHRRVAKR